jgi:hypothetical protein
MLQLLNNLYFQTVIEEGQQELQQKVIVFTIG